MKTGLIQIVEMQDGPGDPRYGQPPDMQFYKTETNFDIDLNEDGDIGFDNKDPVRTSGSPLTYTVKTGEDFYINQWDLLDGYTDPEGHYLFIENITADSNGYITTIYEGEWILSSHNSNFEGDIVLSYTVADEFGGSVDGKLPSPLNLLLIQQLNLKETSL